MIIGNIEGNLICIFFVVTRQFIYINMIITPPTKSIMIIKDGQKIDSFASIAIIRMVLSKIISA